MSSSFVPKYSKSNIFISGGICGAISRSITAPADRLKIMFQSGALEKEARIISTISNIFNEGGIKSFWKGNLTNCIKIVPESAVKFMTFELMKHSPFVKQYSDNPITQKFLSGAIAGAVSQTTIYPLEIVKTRIALSPINQYNSIIDCLKYIIHKDGISSLYKGLNVSVLGIIPYSAVDLGIYHTIKDYRRNHYGIMYPCALEILLTGSISSIIGQLVAYPMQSMRIKLQSQGQMIRLAPALMIECPYYNGMSDCFFHVLSHDGMLGFYRGIIPNFMKSVPAIAVSYLVFEKSKYLLSEYI